MRAGQVKFLSTIKANLIGSVLDGEYAAQMTVTAPEHKLEHSRQRVHRSNSRRRSRSRPPAQRSKNLRATGTSLDFPTRIARGPTDIGSRRAYAALRGRARATLWKSRWVAGTGQSYSRPTTHPGAPPTSGDAGPNSADPGNRKPTCAIRV